MLFSAGILTAVNSATLCFFISEYLLRDNGFERCKKYALRFLIPISVLLFINVFASVPQLKRLEEDLERTVLELPEKKWGVRAIGLFGIFLSLTAFMYSKRGALALRPSSLLAAVLLVCGALVSAIYSSLARVVVCCVVFSAACYYDAARFREEEINFARFLGIGWKVLLFQFLPVFPFVAVFISTVFFFFVSILEFFSLPTNFLNMPVFYCTLYGPFSFLYWLIKKKVLQESSLGAA